MKNSIPTSLANTIEQLARNFVPNNAGFKIPVTSPQDTIHKITEALEFLWNSPELRIKMGKAGYEFASTQAWDRKVTQLEDIYYEVLKARSDAVGERTSN